MTRALALATALMAALTTAGSAVAQAPAAPAQTPAPPAQAPAPAPPATQPTPSAVPVLPLEQARKVMAAAEGEAKRLGLPATIVVVEPGGDIVVAQKMDNAPYGGFDSARRKARAAALGRRSGGQGSGAPIVVPTAGTATGGEQILVGGRLVGAVGVSAGKLQEEQVAKVAAAALR